jgi:hypothetical protein
MSLSSDYSLTEEESMGVNEDIALFEQGLSELIIKYEQYFIGIEKREPQKLLKEVESLGRKYQPSQIVNTMLKFKFNSTVARLNSYKQYWNRINQLIEDGKYSRDRFKMELHQKSRDSGQPEKEEQAKPGEKSPDLEVDSIYHKFIEARKACHLPVSNITHDLIAAAIEKQKPQIINKFKCSGVEFKVVIEEGVPKIKARPKL